MRKGGVLQRSHQLDAGGVAPLLAQTSQLVDADERSDDDDASRKRRRDRRKRFPIHAVVIRPTIEVTPLKDPMLFAGVPISNFARSLAWYVNLFGRVADVNVTEGQEVMW